MVISGLLNYTDSIGDTVFYRNVSWNPRLSQKGRHIFCFKAVDNFGWVTSTKLLKSPSLSFKEGTNAYLQTTQGLSHFSHVSWITAQCCILGRSLGDPTPPPYFGLKIIIKKERIAERRKAGMESYKKQGPSLSSGSVSTTSGLAQ